MLQFFHPQLFIRNTFVWRVLREEATGYYVPFTVFFLQFFDPRKHEFSSAKSVSVLVQPTNSNKTVRHTLLVALACLPTFQRCTDNSRSGRSEFFQAVINSVPFRPACPKNSAQSPIEHFGTSWADAGCNLTMSIGFLGRPPDKWILMRTCFTTWIPEKHAGNREEALAKNSKQMGSALYTYSR